MSRKIKSIIVDDEVGSIEALQWELETFPQIEVIKTYTSSRDAADELSGQNFDLLFLDIEMPVLNGFALLQELNKIDFNVVFTTAYDQFAIQAIKSNALDYLLKPVTEEDLRETVHKVELSLDSTEVEKKLEKLFTQLNNQEGFNTVALPTLEGLEFLEQSEILNCESTSNYTNIFTADGKKILVSKTLKDVSVLLKGEQFFRVHNSHVVNLNHVKKYIRGKGGELVLKNGKHIPVSRSRKEGLLRLF